MMVQSEIGQERLSPNRSKMIALLVLIVLSGGLYLNTLGNLFTNWDDAMVYSNYSIRSLDWKNLQAIFTYVKGSTYQPVRVLSYAIDYHFWKLDSLGYHITNIFFYILTCLMVFFTLQALSAHLRDTAPSDSHFRAAIFGSLLFAAQPVHVEAVTWLAARKEVLQGFFFFLAFFLYLKGREGENKKRALYLSLVLLSILLAVLSKPSSVVFPGVLIVYEIALEKNRRVDFVRKHWIFFILAIIISLVFISILLKVMFDAGGVKPYRGGSFGNNLLVSFYAFLYNIKLLFLTVNYSAAYTIPLPNPLLGLRTFFFVGLTFLLLGYSLWSLKKTKVIFFSFMFFLITVSPYLNIIPISTLLADRYVFIASFAFVFLMGILFDRLYTYRNPRCSEEFFKILAVSLFLLLLSGYSFMTLRQNTIWENSYTLWTDAVEKHPDSNTANALMGVVYMELQMDEKALPYLEKAVQLLPYDYLSRNNLGIVYGKLGESKKGLNELMTAIWLKPADDSIKINLSVLYQRQKEYRKAEKILTYLIEKNPQNANLYFRKGLLFKEEGRFNDAISEFNKSIELAPDIINPYEEIGNIYLSHGKDRGKAAYYYSKGVEILRKGSMKADELRWVIQELEALD